MSNEDKMRENLREQAFELRKAAYEFGLSDHAEDHDRMTKAQRSLFESMESCAAIKDAEIASRDLTVKELLEALNNIIANGDYTAPEGMKRIAKEALAKTEHHNSRALEKMLLEARIDELHAAECITVSFLLLDAEAKLAELNKEQ